MFEQLKSIRTTFVQDPDWNDLVYFAKIIPRVCHNVNRICFVFGGQLEHPILELTPTYLTPIVMATIRQADHLAHQVLSQVKLCELNVTRTVNGQLYHSVPVFGFC